MSAQGVRLRSWELPGHPAQQAQAPPQPQPQPAIPDADREVAGRELAEHLLTLNHEGRLTAKDTCIIAHWATKAGATGPVTDLAFRPNAPSGHFQRHLDAVSGLGADSPLFYRVPVPCHTKHDQRRRVIDVQVMPPHECLHREHMADPALAAKVADTAWPPSYTEHSKVRGRDGHVVPLALYIDAAQYIRRDSVVVFVVCNMLSGSRHLCCVLKKRDMCRCGCRGWCTIHPVMVMLSWSLAALAQGAFPAAQHDGQPFRNDGRRSSLAGMPLTLRGAVCHLKGDWAEYAHTLGFPSWKHHEFPCIWCKADKASIFGWGEVEDDALPWELNSDADYQAACDRCERIVTVAIVQQQELIASLLRYDKKPLGSKGRCLSADVPTMQLSAGDRLEPSAGCPDVAQFEHLPLPATVVFWRPALETMTRHRNPIFSRATGITISCLTVDTLHCLFLGVLQVHCAAVALAMVAADVWDTRAEGNTHATERLQASTIRIQADLHRWHKQRKRDRPTEGLTEVQDIAPSTIGAASLALKGGETKTFFLFLHDLLPRVAGRLDHSADMVAASNALVRHLELLSDPRREFPPDVAQDLGNTPTDLMLVCGRVPLSRLVGSCFPPPKRGFPFSAPAPQEFHQTQMTAIRSMASYAETTPKMHQWLHMTRRTHAMRKGRRNVIWPSALRF